MAYLKRMGESHVAFVHYDSPIHFIYTIIFNFTPLQGVVGLAHVTSVHYAISNPFIYTVIFNFFPDARGFVFESSLIHLIYAILLL